jgi:hypothetical protein
MALKWIEGFDYWSTAEAGLLYPDWSNNARLVIETGSVRYGTRGLRAFATSGGSAGYGWIRRSIGGTEDTVITGFAFRPVTNSNGTSQFMALYEGTTLHVDLRISTGAGSYDLSATMNGTPLGSTVTAAFTDNVWHYVEVKCLIHDTAGTLEVRINGVAVLNLTSQDTKNGGTGFIDRIQLGVTANPANGNDYDFDYDDWYICDDTGSLNNNFLGDIRVAALFPSGAGTTTQWTPSAGSNFQNLEEVGPDGDTTYNSETTASDIDLFAMDNLPTNATTVAGIKEIAYHRKDDAGVRTLRHVVRTGATNYEGSDISVSDSYTYTGVALRETNPNTTVAWTQSDVDGLEAGYKLQA